MLVSCDASQLPLSGAAVWNCHKTRLGLRRLLKVQIRTHLTKGLLIYPLDSSQRSISSGRFFVARDTPLQTTQSSCTSQKMSTSGKKLDESSMQNTTCLTNGTNHWQNEWYEENRSWESQDGNGMSLWGVTIEGS